jgi:DNA invertase Pin-like site-specific DNA recombinase
MTTAAVGAGPDSPTASTRAKRQAAAYWWEPREPNAQRRLASLAAEHHCVIAYSYPERPGDEGKGPARGRMRARAARRDFEVLLVLGPWQLGRSGIAVAKMVAELASYGVTVIAEGSGRIDPKDPGLVGLLNYRNAIVRRSAAALQAKRRRGERVGAIPFGQRLSIDWRTLEADPHEEQVIAHVLAAHDRGLSLRSIAREIADWDVESRRGSPLTHVQVGRILKRAGRL